MFLGALGQHKPFNRYEDLYFSVFFPLAIGKPDEWIFQTKKLSAGQIAKANKLYDINEDGKIQVKEVRKKLLERIPDEFKNQFK